MEIIVHSPVLRGFDSPLFFSPSTFIFPCEVRSPMDTSNLYVDRIIAQLSGPARLSALQMMRQFIFSMSEENELTIRVYFKQIFIKLLKMLAEDPDNLEAILVNVYGLLLKLRQLTVFAHWDHYIERQLCQGNFVTLDVIEKSLALASGAAIGVLREISELRSLTLNQEMIKRGFFESILSALDKDVDTQLNSDTNDSLLDELLNGIAFIASITETAFPQAIEAIPILEKLTLILEPEIELLTARIIFNVYLSAENKTCVTLNTKLIKYSEKMLYMADPSETTKLNSLVELFSNIVRDYDAEGLRKMDLIDVSFMLCQILTERLQQDENLTDNFVLKYNIMGILGKLVLVDANLFNYLVDDRLFLKFLVDEYLDIDHLRFQQSVAFFINNMLIASQGRATRKGMKLLEFFLVDELASVLPKVTKIVRLHSVALKSRTTSKKDKDIIKAVRITAVQILQLLVLKSSSFDKLQMIQYSCLSTFTDLLREVDGGPHVDSSDISLVKLLLLGIYSMLDEYIWLLSEEMSYDDDYQSRIPRLDDLLEILQRQYKTTKSDDVRLLIENVVCQLP